MEAMVKFSIILPWGEGKQDFLLKLCIVFISVPDGVADCVNSSNIEMWWQLGLTAVIWKYGGSLC